MHFDACKDSFYMTNVYIMHRRSNKTCKTLWPEIWIVVVSCIRSRVGVHIDVLLRPSLTSGHKIIQFTGAVLGHVDLPYLLEKEYKCNWKWVWWAFMRECILCVESTLYRAAYYAAQSYTTLTPNKTSPTNWRQAVSQAMLVGDFGCRIE